MRLQAHLKKLFAGIHSVRFGKEETEIVAMRSLEGEEVPLSTAVPITPDVEVTRSDVTEPLNHSLSPSFSASHWQVWLNALSQEMQTTLTELLVECVRVGRGEGGGGIIDPRRYPQQILCLAEQVLFTERCEAAIAEGRLAELLIELESQLDSYTNADIHSVSISAAHINLLYHKLRPNTHTL